jgi:peptidoglycan/LPS O-acetylase OafA/YrhL
MITRNNSLDFIRASAILLVVAVHTSQSFSPAFSPSKTFSASYGAMGVQLFFIISGYTMMLTFGKSTTPGSIFRFYLKRFFRIAPLFWLAGLFYLLKDGFNPRYWAPDGVTWHDVFLTATFLPWLSPSAFNSVVPGGWSIAVEMLFYFLFPIFAFLFLKKHTKILPYALVILIYFGGVLVRKLFLVSYLSEKLSDKSQYLADSFVFFWLPNQILAFGFGFLLYQIVEQKKTPIVGMLLLFFASWTSPFGVSVFCLFLFAYFILTTQIQNSAMSAIGQASYSVYLLHFAVIDLINRVVLKLGIPTVLEVAFLLVILASLALALFITKPLIEDPFIKFGKRITLKLER